MARSDSKPTILVVEDEDDVAGALMRALEKRGFQPIRATTIAGARDMLSREDVRLVLLDMALPDGPGIDLLRTRPEPASNTPVICMTGQGSIDTAIEAMRLGARDFLLKPYQLAALLRSIDAALAKSAPAGTQVPGVKQLVGRSPQFQEIWRQVDVFAGTDITILLLGESGTGKELFARAIHAKSKRAGGPFVELDCASLPPTLIESELFGHEKGAFTDAREARAGKIETASGGTLFLDELGNLSLEVQAKLLRVVQERTFRRIGGQRLIHADVRIVAATNLDLREAVRRGAFRHDLYYRLAEMPIVLTPLRERSGDALVLAEHFLEHYRALYQSSVATISPRARRILESFDWPGNVRELESAMRVAVLQAGTEIGPEHLPPYVAARPTDSPRAPAAASVDRFEVKIPWPADDSGLDLKELTQSVKAQLERHVLRHLMRDRGMNKTQMARYLDLDYKVLTEKIRALDPTGASGDGE